MASLPNKTIDYYYDPSEPNGDYTENTLAGCVGGGEGYEKVDTNKSDDIYLCISGVPAGSTITNISATFTCKNYTWNNSASSLFKYKTTVSCIPVILQNPSFSGSKITSLGSVSTFGNSTTLYSNANLFKAQDKSINQSGSKTLPSNSIVGLKFSIANNVGLGDIWFKLSNVKVTVTYDPPHTCNWVSTGRTEPGCITAGSESLRCSICGATKTNTLDALGHYFDRYVPEHAPTCTRTGNKAYYQCSRCELYFDPDEATLYATNGKSYTAFFIDYLPHSYTGEFVALSNGHSHGYRCVNGCGLYGNSSPHTWDSGSITTQPTCAATGVKTYTCTSGCGGTYTETIPALEHNYDSQVIKPTAAADGYTNHTCGTCGHNYKDNYTINKIFIGTEQPSEIYFDNQKVKEVYYGTTKVYGPK